jgi:hypothetical protein
VHIPQVAVVALRPQSKAAGKFFGCRHVVNNCDRCKLPREKLCCVKLLVYLHKFGIYRWTS